MGLPRKRYPPPVKLVVKFNLVFVGIFAAGLVVAGLASHALLQANARDEVVQNARIMMESALATRTYTTKHIQPLLAKQLELEFLPEMVPAFAATEKFNAMREKYPDFDYKEATLNPTNPRDRATDWEADVVRQFRNTTDLPEVIGERDAAGGRSLYLARPIRIKDDACLMCHSTPDMAPATMIAKYGPNNGFGWQLGEAVGAQIVTVPMAVPIKKADTAFGGFMVSLGAVFGFLFVALNLMLHFLVIRPIGRLAKLADAVSLGKLDAGEFEADKKDEIGVLGKSLGRMKRSVEQAMKMLDDNDEETSP